MSASHETTALLAKWAGGDEQALEDLTRRTYKELRLLAAGYLRKERVDHTLQATAVINEAYVRLLSQKQTPICQNRSQFFAIAAHLMRQILIDHARRRQSRKRGAQKISLEEAMGLADGQSADLLLLDAALKELEQVDARKCKTIELKYFGGLSIGEIAEALNLSIKTVRRDLAFADAWLHQQMTQGRQSQLLALGRH